MSQQDWIPRTDAGARKIVEEIQRLSRQQTEMQSELIDLKAEQKHLVSWQRLALLLGGAAVVIVSACWLVSNFVTSVARVQSDKAAAAVIKLQTEVETEKKQREAGINEVQRDVRAVYNFLLTRKRQSRLEGDE